MHLSQPIANEKLVSAYYVILYLIWLRPIYSGPGPEAGSMSKLRLQTVYCPTTELSLITQIYLLYAYPR
jgi:hypothetical protein